MCSDTRLVIKSEEKGLVTLSLNNPPLNILNIRMMRSLSEAIESSLEAKIVLIRAEGKVFSAGADVGEHMGDTAKEMINAFHGVFRALYRLRGVSVAAVDGPALGGGCELAAFCDIVLASDRASFGQPESLVGVFPPVAAVLWPRLMGEKKALELIVSGDKFDASEAEKLGLVNKVFPAGSFEEDVKHFLTAIKTKSLAVVDHAKRALRRGAGWDFMEALDKVESIYLDSLMKTHDAEEGLRAFIEKRKPNWQDR